MEFGAGHISCPLLFPGTECRKFGVTQLDADVDTKGEGQKGEACQITVQDLAAGERKFQVLYYPLFQGL